MITVRCKMCNKEIANHSAKPQSCGCANMLTVVGDKITALDLSQVIMVESTRQSQRKEVLTSQDLEFQESRKRRNFKRLDFEVR